LSDIDGLYSNEHTVLIASALFINSYSVQNLMLYGVKTSLTNLKE